MILPEIRTGLKGVKYKLGIIRKETGLFEEAGEGRNLILDSGLDAIADHVFTDLTYYCHIGTGTEPFKRDSGAITTSRAGNVITTGGGAAFFEASDVGRLYKFDSGEEVYINLFTSASEVETVTSGTIAASEGTIWYVNRTTLETENKRTSTRRQESGDNSSIVSAGVWSFKRTHIFSAAASDVTLNEIGWSWSNNTTLFNGSLITGSISLLAGDILVVESIFELVQAPQTTLAQADIGGGGFNTTGTIQIEDPGLMEMPSNGSQPNTSFATPMEPSQTNRQAEVAISENSSAFVAYGSNRATVVLDEREPSIGTYAPGSFFRDKITTFPITDGNSTNINSIELRRSSSYPTLRVLLDNPQTKLNTQTLNLGFRLSWGRDLTN